MLNDDLRETAAEITGESPFNFGNIYNEFYKKGNN
jgi:hypothetical protein